MAQSVSNDALWEKLSEMDKKLNELANIQKSEASQQEQTEIKLDFREVKDEITAKIKEESSLLGMHSDINFGTINKNIELLHGSIGKVFNIVSRIRKQQKEFVEPQEASDSHFNFRLFKVRKTSLVITVLALLVLLLTLFCMKQQNDYSLLLDEHYRQTAIIKEIQMKADSLRSISNINVEKKKR